MKLVQLTDTHICADPAATHRGVHLRAGLGRVLELVAAEAADLVVVTGDLSFDGSLQSYEYLASALQGFPVAALLGNHDAPENAEPVRAMLQRRVQLGRWRILLLDSRLDGSVDGLVSEAELAWLRTEASTTEHVVVCLHHNLLADATLGIEVGVSNAEAVLSVFGDLPQVKLVLCGHVHQEHVAGVPPVMVAPTTNFQSLSADGLETGDLPGYRVVELRDDGSFETLVRRLPGSGISISVR